MRSVVGTADGIQSTIRLYPDAFLATNVIVCEGASEVGLIRGPDQYRTANGIDAITAQGTALVDCGGGDADRPFKRAAAFHAVGYGVAVVRDDDKKPTAAVEAAIALPGRAATLAPVQATDGLPRIAGARQDSFDRRHLARQRGAARACSKAAFQSDSGSAREGNGPALNAALRAMASRNRTGPPIPDISPRRQSRG